MKKDEILLIITSFLINRLNNPYIFGCDCDADPVAVVPDIVRIDKDILVPVGKHRQVLMVAFIQDKLNFTGQTSVFLIIFQDNISEVDLHPNRSLRLNTGHFPAFERTS